MHTLIRSERKLKRANFDDSTYQVREKLNNSKISLDLRFYQKLFLIFIAPCIFLIIPELPKDSEIVCKKYHSEEACIVW